MKDFISPYTRRIQYEVRNSTEGYREFYRGPDLEVYEDGRKIVVNGIAHLTPLQYKKFLLNNKQDLRRCNGPKRYSLLQ